MPEFVLRSLKLSGCGKSPTVGWRFKTGVTIQNWRIDYHVSFPYLRAKLKT